MDCEMGRRLAARRGLPRLAEVAQILISTKTVAWSDACSTDSWISGYVSQSVGRVTRLPHSPFRDTLPPVQSGSRLCETMMQSNRFRRPQESNVPGLAPT